MAAKVVQISLEPQLLGQIDQDPEAKERGRSAFIRNAVRLYLQAKERRRVDAQITAAYDGQADSMLEEIEDLIGGQAWPVG